MKSLSLASLAIISIGLSIHSTSSCMEKNNHIGLIDTLMLKHSIAEKGYQNLKHDITKKHQWEINWGALRTTAPYQITHHCAKNDGSELSKEVFHRIYKINVQEVALRLKNPVARMDQNVIDECTTWLSIENSEDVKVTARFHDQAALIAAFNKLKS